MSVDGGKTLFYTFKVLVLVVILLYIRKLITYLCHIHLDNKQYDIYCCKQRSFAENSADGQSLTEMYFYILSNE